jgi:hypothetical protein
MKKLMILCAIALSLNTITVKAQEQTTSLAGVSMETQTVVKSKSNVKNNRVGISIWFGKAGCNPGFGICRIDIGNQAASRVTADNQLTGTASTDERGNLNLDLVSNATNRAFVEKLKNNGALELDQDVSFREVVQKLQESGGSASAKAISPSYDLKQAKKYSVTTNERGSIVIIIHAGDVTITITIKW